MSNISQIHELDLKSGRITRMHWSPDGQWLSVPTESGATFIIDAGSGRVARKLEGEAEPVTTAGWHRNSEFLFTGSQSGKGVVWDVREGKRADFELEGHKSAIHSIEWTDEGAYVVTCSSDHFRALDGLCLLSGWSPDMEESFNEHTGFTAAACSHNSSFLFAVASGGSTLRLSSLLGANVLASRPGDSIQSLVWSPAEDLLAAGSDRGIQLHWANQEGFEKSTLELTKDAHRVGSLAFSPRGDLLASQDNRSLTIWDVAAGKAVESVPAGQGSSNTGIAFHPTKALVAAVGDRGSEFRYLDLSKLA